MGFEIFKAAIALGILSLKGDGRKTPKEHGEYSNGVWGTISQEKLKTYYTQHITDFINMKNYWWYQSVSYNNVTWPAYIWGWRSYDPEKKVPIYAYAHFNNCPVSELCKRYIDGKIYLDFGIENFSSHNSMYSFSEKQLDKEYFNWVRQISPGCLVKDNNSEEYMIDRWGNRWYYLSKDNLYDELLIPYRNEIVKHELNL